MRNEMKRNNKMLLALVVVAALAMVSVAGIAVSEKSDAANRIDQMNGGLTIFDGSDSSLNARFFILPNQVADGGMQYVKIAPGVTLSGTITVGTADNVNGANYKEYASVTLTGVSNAVFNLLMAPDGKGGLMGIIMVGDAADVNLAAATPDKVITNYATTTGSIELTNGALVLGAVRPISEGVIGALAPLWKDALAGSTATDNIGGNVGSRIFGMVDTTSPTYGAKLIANLVTFNVPDWKTVINIPVIPGGVAPFTGTVKAGDSQLSTAYAYGARVGLVDGKATVFGEVVADVANLPWKAVKYPVNNINTTAVDESQVYNVLGTPTIPVVAPGTTVAPLDPVTNKAISLYIPAQDFSERNIKFVSGSWSVAMPTGFATRDGNYLRLVNINGVVEAAATVIVGDNMPQVGDVTIAINEFVRPADPTSAVQATSDDILWLIPASGAALGPVQAVAGPAAPANSTFRFTFLGVALNTPYTLVGIVNGLPYQSTMTVNGTGANYSANVTANRANGIVTDGTVLPALGLDLKGNDLTYNIAGMGSCTAAWSTNTGNLTVTKNDATTGLIVGANDAKQAGATLFALFNQGGVTRMFMTDLTPNTAPATTNDGLVTANTSGVGFVAPFPQPMPTQGRLTNVEVLPESKVTTFELSTQAYDSTFAGAYFAPDGYTFTVKGYMNFMFTNDSAPEIKGIFVQPSDYANVTLPLVGIVPPAALTGTNGTVYNINLEGTGTIEYGAVPQIEPDLVFHPMYDVTNLNAVFYVENVGTAPDKTTYYYTTLENALANSNEVTVVGWIYILEDQTLQGHVKTSAGVLQLADNTKINISVNSGLQIGLKAYNVNGKTVMGWKALWPFGGIVIPDQSYNPVVNLPEGTVVEKTTTSSQYLVQFGQAVYDVKPEYDINTPLAEVLIVGAKYIYTDLWTALNISVSGDTINLLVFPREVDGNPVTFPDFSGAILDQNGTLKAGVKLVDDQNAELWVAEGVVLLANGSIQSTQPMAIDGTIIVAGSDANQSKFTDGAQATFGQNGGINVSEGGVLLVDGDTTAIIGAAGVGAIKVDGTMNVKGASVSADIIQIAGTVDATAGSTVEAFFAFIIGKTPTLVSEPYTNTASVKGPTSVYLVDYIAVVFGDLSVPAFADLAYTDYVIPSVPNDIMSMGIPKLASDVLYATVYGDNGNLPSFMVKPLNFTTALKDIIIFGWSDVRDGQTDVVGNDVLPVGTYDTVYAIWDWKTVAITLANYAGVNWTAYSKPVGWSNTAANQGNGNPNGSGTFYVPYNMVIVVSAAPNAGFGDTTVQVKLNGVNFTNGGTLKVTEEALFTAENLSTTQPPVTTPEKDGKSGSSWSDPMVILLIIIVIIIAIIAIVVAAKLLRS
ncbi:hypothetical protein Mpt1_c02490 [Candidatus Methanoplasma termitum]|uniref:Uncharacterized protein n=2 Tax=Candidatus Methanoplasma termitum TaxID=1577791 RepID=A0A0A7LAQ9_9ARCH|nr:hypothetical protein Mpt1_c02490 [Candidatus Methanoplasma termitum]